jgi:HEAT repeat protein
VTRGLEPPVSTPFDYDQPAVSIRASSSRQIESLVADLSAADAATREAAVARLTVMGSRAVERLAALAGSSAPAGARTTALRTLEAIGDPRALTPALHILADAASEPEVGAAAAGVARVFLRGRQGAAAVDRLTAVVLDRGRAEALRLAALRALKTLDPATIAPVLTALAGDPSPAILAEAATKKTARRVPADPVAAVTSAAEQGLPGGTGSAAALRQVLAVAGDLVPLPTLLRVIERLREREAAEPLTRRQEWTMTRAAAHVALASRGSRLGLYDLRESLEAATAPLPVEFLAALSMAGDVSCLEPIAGAHARAKNAWWREHLADAFRTIVAREKLTRRHAAVRRIEKRWPQTLLELWAGGSDKAGGSGRAGGARGSGKPGRAGKAGG